VEGKVEKLPVEIMLFLLLQGEVLVLVHWWQQWSRSSKPVPGVV